MDYLILTDLSLVQATVGQCDCACANSAQAMPVREQLNPSQLYQNQIAATYPLDSEHVVAHLPGSRPVVLNHCALNLARQFQVPQAPATFLNAYPDRPEAAAVRDALSRMVAYGMLRRVGDDRPICHDSAQKIIAWLHITDQCNLRCSYCYLPHQSLTMALQTGFNAIDATFRSAIRHALPQVTLKYAGGEPLLQFQKVVRWHTYAVSQAQQAGLSLEGVVLTNGTLLDCQLLRKIKEVGLKLMVSVDEFGDSPTAQRLDVRGHATSAQVLERIKMAINEGLVPDISITVTRRNSARLADLLAWILNHHLPFNLNFYRPNDLAAEDLALTRTGQDELLDGILAAYRVVEQKLPQTSLLASLVDRANLSFPHQTACSAGINYLVFDPLGKIYQCQMAMTEPVADVKSDDPLSLVRSAPHGIQNLDVDQTQCAACIWRYACAGGCSLMTYRQTGRYDLSSPYCDLYRALYPEAIRLEGLRLLRNALIQ